MTDPKRFRSTIAPVKWSSLSMRCSLLTLVAMETKDLSIMTWLRSNWHNRKHWNLMNSASAVSVIAEEPICEQPWVTGVSVWSLLRFHESIARRHVLKGHSNRRMTPIGESNDSRERTWVVKREERWQRAKREERMNSNKVADSLHECMQVVDVSVNTETENTDKMC